MMDKTDKAPDVRGQRIAKAIARAGLASRREAEAWIADGRVAVNGTIISSPAVKVTVRDVVTVDGKPLPQRERTRLFLFHKSRGLVTTTSDPQGRPTVFSALPKDLPRLISVGRLDFNTEGLLLLTNDGGLARVLEHPATGWLRRYRVRAHGTVTQAQLEPLRDGIIVEGVRYGPIEARLDRSQGTNVWLTFAIREGKNREVRNVLDALGLKVSRLIRVSFGPFQLRDLSEGAIEEVPTRVLREQLGKKVVERAGAEFDAPVAHRPQAEAPRVQNRPSKGEGRRPSSPEQARGRSLKDRLRRPPQDAGARPGKRRPWHGRERNVALSEQRMDSDIPRKTKAGLLTDRKGRRVLVQRTRADRLETPPNRPKRRPPSDRRHGPRPSRPRSPRDKG